MIFSHFQFDERYAHFEIKTLEAPDIEKVSNQLCLAPFFTTADDENKREKLVQKRRLFAEMKNEN